MLPTPATPPFEPTSLPATVADSNRRILWIVALYRAVCGAVLLGIALLADLQALAVAAPNTFVTAAGLYFLFGLGSFWWLQQQQRLPLQLPALSLVLLVGDISLLAVVVASLRSGPDEAPADRTAETGHAEAYREVLDEQRRLLAEETKALRAELRSLHDERIATRRDRITNLAERFHEGEEAEYDTIALRNACTVEIAVALHYLDLDDAWITRGWWNVAPGQTVTTDAMTRNAYVYFYGENRSAGRSWNGDGTEEALTLDVVQACAQLPDLRERLLDR